MKNKEHIPPNARTDPACLLKPVRPQARCWLSWGPQVGAWGWGSLSAAACGRQPPEQPAPPSLTSLMDLRTQRISHVLHHDTSMHHHDAYPNLLRSRPMRTRAHTALLP